MRTASLCSADSIRYACVYGATDGDYMVSVPSETAVPSARLTVV